MSEEPENFNVHDFEIVSEASKNRRSEICPRCNGTGRHESALRRRGRPVWVKCDCMFDDFGRRKPPTSREGGAS